MGKMKPETKPNPLLSDSDATMYGLVELERLSSSLANLSTTARIIADAMEDDEDAALYYSPVRCIEALLDVEASRCYEAVRIIKAAAKGLSNRI